MEANTNITNVLVGKDDTNLENVTLQPDGSYYYKIDRVDNAFIKVELESTKSTSSINGEVGDVVSVDLPDEINTFTIQVVAEDGTIKETKLVIEKKSNDTDIESITGQYVLETDIQEEMAYVYVDEDITTVDITITLTHALAKLKLDTDTDYEVNSITRTVDLTDYATNGVINLNLLIQAEDGTERQYIVSIYKQPNLDLTSVSVNSGIVTYDEVNEKYFKLVSNGNTPQIVITPSNLNQTVQLLDIEGNILATAVGTLTTTVTLSTTDLTTNYIIKVISHNGEDYGTYEYNLEIRQKSTETGITYIKVDGLGTAVSTDKLTYSSTVAGKDKYPVEIKLKDENAQVRIQDTEGNILINNQTGILTGELAVADGETKQFTVVVTSENGEEQSYALSIERISSNLDIKEITITDYDTDGTTLITKNVVNYDENTKTYKIIVNRYLTESDVTITAVSSFTNIVVDSVITAKETVSLTKQLNGLGITEITIELTAADGNQETRYLHIVQLSDEIGIQTVEVDGIELSPNEAGDYETTVTNENDLSEVKVTLPVDTSKVSINGNAAEVQTSTVNVRKGNSRKLEIPIKVTAEDGTTYAYKLTLNIISHDTSVQSVKVDGEESSFVEGIFSLDETTDSEGTDESEQTENVAYGKYTAYFDKNATEANVEITAGVPYSTVSHTMEDSTEVLNLEKLNFVLQTNDLTQTTYTTTFKVTAEDGTEKQYILECIRKSDDNTISGVFVNDTELQPNSGHLQYADGTYYIAVVKNTAKVKVSANSEFAIVTFNGKSGTQILEQTITLDTNNKVTEVPVTITSQQGTTFETIIYIEKVSNNFNLASVEVNYEQAETPEIENKFLSYIYDTVTTAKVEITAENEQATIIRVLENGETYLDENGLSSQAKGVLTMDIETPENTTIIYFKIVAENGEESEIYTLQIEKMSTDTTLKEVYVDGILIEPNEDGKYITNVPDTQETPVVKAVTNHHLAHVRIVLGDEYLNIAEESITMSSNKQTVVPITVRSQSGITKVTYLYLNRVSTSVKLNTVTIDDNEADSYNDATSTYRFLVEDTKTDFELFILAESDYTMLEYEGAEYQASFKSVVNMETTVEGKTLQVKAKAESGSERIYTIELVHKSDNTDLEYLKVSDIERYPDEEGGDTYTVMIPKLATTTLIEVKTVHNYATVRLGDNQVMTQHDRGELDCSDLTQDRILVPVVVTAADGTTIRTYNILLLRGSNDTQIELKLNDEILKSDENGNYFGKVLYGTDIKINATALNEGITGIYASIDINTTGIYGTPSKQVIITEEEYKDKDQIKVPIQINAEDGTLKESILTIEIIYGTYITGKITTENVNGEYISEVTVYKTSDISNPRQELVKVQTEPDGTFKVLIHQMSDTIIDENINGIADELEENYDIVVTKKGYLNYTVTNIGVKEAKETILDEYKLIAGDVVETGEIEIDDLVLLNDNIGGVITEQNKEFKLIYDLNEDGNIDILDRNILKTNYHKKSETIKWVDTNAVTTYALSTMSLDDNLECAQSVNSNGYILPMACDYRISSNYGYRVHPVSGETKLHSGIDIVGTWHTEILAVADGEITYSGVQNGYGNCIEIKHIVNGETIYTFYAHLSEIKVSGGEKVSQGQVIALEGGDASDPNPGTSTGHHLHFEFRSASGSGHSIDPNNYINF
ncbi:MAG: M23 family metallopeptidase [Clostridia bacterium]|nr:M23 family metallopeptidase [Clostridia bacterium]